MTPQTILILLCAAAAVLLLIRLSIGGSGRRLRSPDVGSSMTIGGREVQEDFVGTLATQTGLVAVLADGMGKAYGARIASRTAVETFLDLFRDYTAFDNPQYYFRKSFHAANRAILREIFYREYRIEEAHMLCEDGKYYAMMRVKHGKMTPLTEIEQKYGPVLLAKKDPVLKEFLEREERKFEEIREHLGVMEGEKSALRKREVEKELEDIRAAKERLD